MMCDAEVNPDSLGVKRTEKGRLGHTMTVHQVINIRCVWKMYYLFPHSYDKKM